MQEIKDEILEGEARYRIRDNNGNIIQDNVNIEQITPVLQEGTPINKELFNNIGNEILGTQNIIKSHTIYKTPDSYSYNSSTGEMKFDVIDPLITQYTPNQFISFKYDEAIREYSTRCNFAVKVMVSNKAGWAASETALQRFNGGIDTTANGTSMYAGGYFEVELNQPIIPKQFIIEQYSGSDSDYKQYIVTNYQIWGSNNGTDWTNIKSSTNTTQGSFYTSVEAYGKAYKYFKLVYTGIASVCWAYGFGATLYETAIPYASYPLINVNNLGAVKVNGNLYPHKGYQLMYNGTRWDINYDVSSELANLSNAKINKSNFKQGTTTISIKLTGSSSVTFDTPFQNIPAVMAIGNYVADGYPQYTSLITLVSVSTGGFSYKATFPTDASTSSTRTITVYWIAIDTIS